MRIPMALITLTNARIGTMETPSQLVDLPLYRDVFGKIVIRGEYLKGAIRSRVHLGDSSLTELIFGCGEVIGSIVFNDAVAAFIPVPVKGHGLIYFTSPELLNRFAFALNNTKNRSFRSYLDRLAEKMMYIPNDNIYAYLGQKINSKDVILFGEAKFRLINREFLKPLSDFAKELLGAVSGNIKPIKDYIGGIGIVNDDVFNVLQDRLTSIQPRIQLKGMNEGKDVYNKTVGQGPWFEEEIPKFTIFVGILSINRQRMPRNIFKELFKKTLQENLLNELSIKFEDDKIVLSENYLKSIISKYLNPIVVSAKETTGRGLFKTKELLNLDAIIKNIDHVLKELESEETLKSPSSQEIFTYDTAFITETALKIFNELRRNVPPEKFEGWIKNIQGKVSVLPERIRRLGIYTTFLFYTKLKREAKGKGYEEVRKILELQRQYIKNINFEKLEQTLKAYDVTEQVLNKLKYIIRAYHVGEVEA